MLVRHEVRHDVPALSRVADQLQGLGQGVAIGGTALGLAVDSAGCALGTGVASAGSSLGTGVATAGHSVGTGAAAGGHSVGAGLSDLGGGVGSHGESMRQGMEGSAGRLASGVENAARDVSQGAQSVGQSHERVANSMIGACGILSGIFLAAKGIHAHHFMECMGECFFGLLAMAYGARQHNHLPSFRMATPPQKPPAAVPSDFEEMRRELQVTNFQLQQTKAKVEELEAAKDEARRQDERRQQEVLVQEDEAAVRQKRDFEHRSQVLELLELLSMSLHTTMLRSSETTVIVIKDVNGNWSGNGAITRGGTFGWVNQEALFSRLAGWCYKEGYGHDVLQDASAFFLECRDPTKNLPNMYHLDVNELDKKITNLRSDLRGVERTLSELTKQKIDPRFLRAISRSRDSQAVPAPLLQLCN